MPIPIDHDPWMRRAGVGLGILLLVLTAAAFRPQRAAATVQPRAAIVSVSASPGRMPAAGGAVVVTVRVKNALTCTFSGQRAAFASVSAGPSVPCGSGHASARLAIGENTHYADATIHLYVRARDAAGHTVQRSTTVVESAAPQPLAVDTQSLTPAAIGVAYSTDLFASGGTAPYAWVVGAGTLPAGLTLAPDGTISGTPTTLGTSSFTVEVTDTADSNATAQLTLQVVAHPVEQSNNWSGYYVTGGPFSSVSGTFNVPSLTTKRTADTAEWVGLDGAVDGDPSLIQAGIEERYSTATKTARFYAWWEILPATETMVPLGVAAGDTVTVTIAEESAVGGMWQIAIVDDTNGQTYSTQQSYDGPATTAEWIVEAPTDVGTGDVLPLGHYTPNVTFSAVSAVGAEQALREVELVQEGTVVSAPSPLDANGFSVAFGAAAPPAP